MGIWEVKVYHFNNIGDKEGHAIAFMMTDLDAKKGCLPKAFERAVDAVNKALNNKKERKNG